MKTELFRKAQCSERLPKDGGVVYSGNDDDQEITLETNVTIQKYSMDWWLEPVEMSVGKIEDIINIHLQPLDITGLDANEINELEGHHDELVNRIAQAIHDLIYGEEGEE